MAEFGTLTWSEFNPANALPSSVTSILSSLESALSTIQTFIEAVVAVFNVLKTFIISVDDFLKAILEALRADIEALIETLQEAGLRVLFHFPRGPQNALTPSGWVQSVVNSFTDQGDKNRPEFSTTQGQAGALVMLAVPDFADLLAKAQAMVGALGKPFKYRTGVVGLRAKTDEELAATGFPPFLVDKVALQEGYGQNVNRGGGVVPDWEQPVLLKDLFPPFQQLANVLKKALGLLVFGLGFSDLIDQYVTFMEGKLALIQALVAELNAVIAIFEALLSITDVHVLFFEGSGTTAELQSAIRAAGIPSAVAAQGTLVMAGGMVVHVAGDPSSEIAQTVALLRGLFGAF